MLSHHLPSPLWHYTHSLSLFFLRLAFTVRMMRFNWLLGLRDNHQDIPAEFQEPQSFSLLLMEGSSEQEAETGVWLDKTSGSQLCLAERCCV